MQVNSENLSAFLDTIPNRKRFLIAYSGGMDSHVLLHLMASLGPEAGHGIRAVHVNHHIQPESRSWAGHCRDVCRALGVELEVLDADASRPEKESPESWARHKRYAAIENILGEGEVLLTAHHRDDQLETFLLRLLRGSGVLGLTAMRAVRRFGRGLHARPLLKYPRAELLAYARLHGLNWIEDPSNTDIRPDRNYLRHEVVPAIRDRWPSAALPVSRTIDILAETQGLLDDLARQDLLTCNAEAPDVVHVERVKLLPAPRQKNMLRYWCRVLGLPSPDSRRLAHILTDVIESRRDSVARFSWKGAELQRYGQYIHLGAPPEEFDGSVTRVWDFTGPCRLDYGELTALEGRGNGLKQDMCAGARVEVRYRRGGEKIRLPGRSCRHKLKKLFQEAGTPPWLRVRVPLIYVDDRLAMVAGLWTDTEFAATGDEPSWFITWHRPLKKI